jgi:hypothetical protein
MLAKDPNIKAVMTDYDRLKQRDALLDDGYWPLTEVGSAESRVLDWGIPCQTGPDPDLVDHKLRWWVPMWIWLLMDQAWAQGKLDAAKEEFQACMEDPNRKRILLCEEKMRLGKYKLEDSVFVRSLESALGHVERECQTKSER